MKVRYELNKKYGLILLMENFEGPKA